VFERDCTVKNAVHIETRGVKQGMCQAVKCTRKEYTSSQAYATPVRVGYTRHWNKEEFGWSYIDWDVSELSLLIKCTTKIYTSRQDYVLPPKVGYTSHWNKEEFGWSYIDYDDCEFRSLNTRLS